MRTAPQNKSVLGRIRDALSPVQQDIFDRNTAGFALTGEEHHETGKAVALAQEAAIAADPFRQRLRKLGEPEPDDAKELARCEADFDAAQAAVREARAKGRRIEREVRELRDKGMWLSREDRRAVDLPSEQLRKQQQLDAAVRDLEVAESDYRGAERARQRIRKVIRNKANAKRMYARLKEAGL